jgi:colanic acid/amylovoran biosynthesis glycosyltransferase
MPVDRPIAYVVSRYPAPSHTFVLREVRALRRLGTRIDTFSIRSPDAAELPSSLDRDEAATTTDILPVGVVRLLRTHLGLWRHHGGAYLATGRLALRSAPPGLRAALWQVFYLTEAVLLLDHCRTRGIRRLHAHFANVGADVCWLATELGRRVEPDGDWAWSFTMHGPTEFFEIQAFNLRRKVEHADRVVCISEYCRSQLMRLVAATSWDKLHVVHCGVDTTQFVPVGGTRSDSGPLTVLCIGRLCAEKGQAVLLDAVALLVGRGVAIRLVLAGGGPDRAALERRRDELGLAGTVEMLGVVGQDRLTGLLAAADIFCLPSFAEGVPIVLMEAMASGLPVVTTPIAGIPELVVDGESGLLVAPGRADLLAAALDALGSDPERRHRLGVAGRDAVLAGFDLDTNVTRLREVLAGL